MIIKFRNSKWDIRFTENGLEITNVSNQIELTIDDEKIRPNVIQDIVGLKQIEMKR